MPSRDSDDRLVLWNSQYAETYRAPGGAIAAGMRFEDILRGGLARGQYADAVGKEEEWLAARLAGHAQPSNRHEQLLSSGRYIVVEERRTANGGSIGVRIDVTEMKQREELFRLLFKGNPMPMWVIDVETLKFLAVNAAAVAHYGYSRDEFLQMTALDLRPADDREQLVESFQSGRSSQGSRIWRHRKADGTGILVSVYRADLTYAGRAARLCAVVDVTERKRAKEKLTEQKMQTDMAINNMSQGLLMFDSQARLVLCNDRYIEMYDLVRRGGEAGLHVARARRSSTEGRLVFGRPRAILPRRSRRGRQRHDVEQDDRAVRRTDHPCREPADAGRRLGRDA